MTVAVRLPCWTVLLYFLSRLSWTFPAEGQSRLIGPPQPIAASPGDNVILPCHLEPRLDAWWLTLEWTRTDIKPDPSDRLRPVGYVYLRRGGVELKDMKIPSYADRAALLANELKRGIMSLRIRNVTTADEGTYQCFVPILNSYVLVQLVVDSKSVETTTTMTTRPTRDLQTPDPTNSNGGRKRHIVWILPAVAIVSLVATAVAFIVRHKRRQHVDVHDEETDDDASCFIVPETPRVDQSKTPAA